MMMFYSRHMRIDKFFKNILLYFVVIMMTVISIVIFNRDNAKATSLQPTSKIIPSELFGLHIHRATSSTPWPVAPFGTWRLWDCYVQWPWLEPNKGEWHFEHLDKIVALAEKNEVHILLPLGLTPTWASKRPAEKSAYGIGHQGYAAEPRNLDDWRNYIRSVATRYRGRIKDYEIWNEPNLPSFFSGSQEQMILLAQEAYRILKEVDPTIRVVSPSATSDTGPAWLDSYLAKGGAKIADVIGYHFYVSPHQPESMLPIIARVKQIMVKYGVHNKPLWNTETGWFIANRLTDVKADPSGFKGKVLSEGEASGYIARSYLLSWASGIERFYWYSWDGEEIGLTEADGKHIKSVARAYAEVFDWLVGSRIINCSSDMNGTWICLLLRNDGRSAWIVWNPQTVFTFDIPKSWDVNQMRGLDRQSIAIKTGARLEIGSVPVMLWKTSQDIN